MLLLPTQGIRANSDDGWMELRVVLLQSGREIIVELAEAVFLRLGRS